MNRSTNTIAFSLSSLLMVSAMTAAIAGQHSDRGLKHKQSNPTLINEVSIGINDAMAIALADVDGKVFEIELEQEDNTTLWEIEILDSSNNVIEFEIDANSGAILDKQQDNN